jgi:adenylate cyclase
VQDNGGQTYPAFTLAVLHTLFAMPLPQQYLLRDGTLYLLDRDIQVDDSYNLRINFAAEGKSRPYLSYGQVISGDFDPSIVKNKIVLIGMTATGELDTWAIPTSVSKVPGVFIHAAAMDTILRQQFLMESGIGVSLIIIALLLGITAFALPRLRLRWGFILVGGLFIVYLIASFFTFDNGYILNILYPLSLLPIIYIGNIVCQTVAEQSDKRFVKDLFGRYVSPQVANEILSLADSDTLTLGGEQREVTILFADIREFTQLSERLSPEALVNMLNTYLSTVIDVVLQNDGMVNKFTGDNIMAVWNAPQSQLEHARLAVKTAWEAQQKIIDLQQRDSSLPPVQFGIGINTGKALAGNVGSVGRTEYTVIGDAVNLASRICSATPGGEVWIGPETYQQVKEFAEVAELEPQKFKGKAESVVVYRLTHWR